MHKEFLMGNAAIARGAIAAGLNLAAGYPGTPSTEVLETIAKTRPKNVYVEWSVNEKAAMELAAGASYAGARTMVTMKQVGLNVASDPLMSLEYIGIKGGMVILVADDPGPISSQTEQDTRHFAAFSKVPCFDPFSAQEAYEMVQEAFRYSEKYGTPVFLRPTTRVCHGYASVTVKDEAEYTVHAAEGFVKDSGRWVIFPRLSFQNHRKIEKRNVQLSEDFSAYKRNRIITAGSPAAASAGNALVPGTSGNTSAEENLAPGSPDTLSAEGTLASDSSDTAPAENTLLDDSFCSTSAKDSVSKKGIAASGISFTYAMETLAETGMVPLLKIATPFPFPERLAVKFLQGKEEILCLEELDPVIERELTYLCGKYHLPARILGKLTGHTANAGENSRDSVSSYICEFLKEFPKKPEAAASCANTASPRSAPQDAASSRAGDPNAGAPCAADPNAGAPCAADPNADALDAVGQDICERSAAAKVQSMASARSQDPEASAKAAAQKTPPQLPVRPPVLCAGCPHRASFYAVKRAMKGRKTIFCGDIGCYTLGNAMPLDMVDTCLCMGAGLNIAQGVEHIEPDTVCFAFVGDSTFFASAITGVVNAVYNQTNLFLVVLDNSTTAMTGHQPHPGTGRTAAGEIVQKISIEAVLRGIGVENVETVNPLELDTAITEVKRMADLSGVKALIFKSPCIAIVQPDEPLHVDQARCIRCRRCIRELGCPALQIRNEQIEIDASLCTGCGLCTNVCPPGAILRGREHAAASALQKGDRPK